MFDYLIRCRCSMLFQTLFLLGLDIIVILRRFYFISSRPRHIRLVDTVRQACDLGH